MGSSALCTTQLHSEPVFAIAAARSSKGQRVLTGGGDAVMRRMALTLPVDGGAGTGSFKAVDKADLPHPGTEYRTTCVLVSWC
jgi:hypothetical protein